MTVAVRLSTTVLEPSTSWIVAVWPFSTPVVVPLMAKPAAASAVLMVLSPAMVAMAIETEVSLTVRVWVASVAWLPAWSATSAFTV